MVKIDLTGNVVTNTQSIDNNNIKKKNNALFKVRRPKVEDGVGVNPFTNQQNAQGPQFNNNPLNEESATMNSLLSGELLLFKTSSSSLLNISAFPDRLFTIKYASLSSIFDTILNFEGCMIN